MSFALLILFNVDSLSQSHPKYLYEDMLIIIKAKLKSLATFPHFIPPYFPTFITFESVIIFKTKHPWQRRNQLQS